MTDSKLKFKKIDGTHINDIAEYIKEYIKMSDCDIDIMIGCDSLPKKYRRSTYTTVIAIYKIGKGAHVVYNREHNVKTNGLIDRLWEEVERSIQIAQHLKNEGVMSIKNVRALDIHLHLDVNEQEQHDSNVIMKSAIGYVTSMGFKCSIKPDAPAASYAADKICRGYDLALLNN